MQPPQGMNPQLEEYRRKQRERAATQRSTQSSSPASSPMFFGAVAVLVVAVAAAVFLHRPAEASVSPAEAASKKAGVCPKPVGIGTCAEECKSNADCAGADLCCSNGCGHVCMKPERPGKPTKAGNCVLMAALEKGADVEALLHAVPAPSSHKHLAATGILLLRYEAQQDGTVARAYWEAECCGAEKALSERQDVKSVEYDGRAPDCERIRERGSSSQDSEEASEGEPRMVGGNSAAEELDDTAKEVWQMIKDRKANSDKFDIEQHEGLGDPVKVQTQVVAGVILTYHFAGGEQMRVFWQVWTKTLQVLGVKRPGDKEA
eukprot:TRINITY_DN50479_c0_g1_i1.p1 TRINITY_DN50479_c0_g1~~TRINITY_DN50479_c0_g1_i1.p1  ORF type:complete len:319 (+),score=76.58 TRINITY_DN50479_c0_g1_i1:95-1051(+)